MYAETVAPESAATQQTAQPSAPQPAPHLDPRHAPRLDPHPGRATGPRTPEGKARSSRNAITHGLTSQEAVLLEEDANDFEALRQGFIADLRPAGETEETLVEIIAMATWRLRRIWRMEPGVFAAWRAKAGKNVNAGGVWMLDCMGDGALEKLGRHEARFHRELMQSEARLRLLQKQRAVGLERPYRVSEQRRASTSTDGSNGKFAKRTPPAPGGAGSATPTEADAQALLAAVHVEPLAPHPVHGAAVRDELTLVVREPDGRTRELARRVIGNNGNHR